MRLAVENKHHFIAAEAFRPNFTAMDATPGDDYFCNCSMLPV